MQIGTAQCVNKGMQRDYSMDKASQEFAYENHNIRITTTGNESFLSVTNEKSTIPYTPIKVSLSLVSNVDTDKMRWDFFVRALSGTDESVNVTVEFKDINNNIIESKDFSLVKHATFSYHTNIKAVKATIRSVNAIITNYSASTNVEIVNNCGYINSNIIGNIIGSTTLGDYLILFTKDKENNIDFIYKINCSDASYLSVIKLYEGNLNFDIESPIECITSYEGDEVLKVYWVDGLNQPRYINVFPDTTYPENTSFDFVPSIVEGVSVSIEKEYNGTGQFNSGVIQYYITYYKKFGAETNAVYQSPLYYISPSDRGGKVNENQTCNFKITIQPETDKYDYVRVYSLIRTSLNNLQVAIVADASINKNDDGSFKEIQVLDTNTNTIPVDPTDIMFLGGNTVIASTIEQKDNTLFLGNIEELKTSFDLQFIKNKINALKTDNSRNFTLKEDECHLPESILKFKWKVFGYNNESLNSQYDYYNQLNKDSYSIKGFKHNEVYRFGFQLQTATGEWTQTIYLDDLVCDKYPILKDEFTEIDNSDYLLLSNAEEVFSNYMYLPYIWFDPSEIFLGTDLKDFISYRLVMAEPSLQDRSIVCQGYITPTLYNPRLGNVSSWNTKFNNEDNKHWNNVLYLGKNNEEQIVPTPKTDLDLSLYTDDNIELKGYNISPENYSDGWKLISIDIIYRALKEGTVTTAIEFIFNFYNVDLGNKSVTVWYGENYYDKYFITSSGYFSGDTTYYQRYNAYKRAKSIAMLASYTTRVSHESDDYGFPIFSGETLKEYLESQLKAVSLNLEDTVLHNEGEFPQVSKNEAKSKKVFEKRNTVDRKYELSYIEQEKNERENHYFIDASTCNIFAPNFNEVSPLIDDSNLKFRIIGKADFSKNVTSFNLEGNNTIEDTNKDFSLNFKFSGNLNEERKTFGLQSYPLWNSFSRESNDNPSRYNWTFLWNTNDLSKSGDELSTIKNKTFANLYYSDNTIYADSSKILWKPKSLSILKSITDSLTFINDAIYTKDVEDSMFPENEYIYYMDKPYESNFQPYNYKDTIKSKVEHKFDSVDIQYNTTNHILLQFDNYKNRVVTLPGYESKLESLWNGNTIDIINNSVLPLGETNYTNMVFQDAYSDKDNYFADNFSIIRGTAYYSYIGDKQFKNNDVVLYFYKEQGHVDINGNLTGDYYFGNKYDLPSFRIGIYKTEWNTIQDAFLFVEPRTLLESEKVGGVLDTFNDTALPILQSKDIVFNFYHSDINNSTWEVYGKYQIDIVTENWNGEEVTRAVINNYNPFYINPINVEINNSLWICELYKDFNDFNPYGGTEQNAIELNTFIPISSSTKIGSSCNGLEGDTYFQRWDSLRTYPNTEEQQGVVDVVSLMLETHENLDGRSDITRGRTDVDIIRPNNIQETINEVYNQENNYITSVVLDEKFEDSTHPTLYTWSLTKQSLSDIDTWTSINLSRSAKLDGDKGVLTKIKRWNNNLLAFQERGLAVINFNQQTTISTDAGVPIEIAASGLVSGHYYISSTQGCKNKWSIIDSPYGIYFIDSYNKSINVFGSEGIKSLSTLNLFQDWIIENEKGVVWNHDNEGFKSFYDSIHKEVYFVNNETALCYNELLSQFTSFYDYGKLNTMAVLNNSIYGIKNNNIHRMFEGDTYCNLFGIQVPYSITYKVNKDPFVDKTWTNVEYRADIFDKGNINNNPIKTLQTFDTLEVWNEYQRGVYDMSKAKPRFRIWRAHIPRDTNEGRGLNRIRNPWIMLKLSKNSNTSDKRIEFHDLLVRYLY